MVLAGCGQAGVGPLDDAPHADGGTAPDDLLCPRYSGLTSPGLRRVYTSDDGSTRETFVVARFERSGDLTTVEVDYEAVVNDRGTVTTREGVYTFDCGPEGAREVGTRYEERRGDDESAMVTGRWSPPRLEVPWDLAVGTTWTSTSRHDGRRVLPSGLAFVSGHQPGTYVFEAADDAPYAVPADTFDDVVHVEGRFEGRDSSGDPFRRVYAKDVGLIEGYGRRLVEWTR